MTISPNARLGKGVFMSGELQFPLECSSCGNFQYFKEVRAQVHEVHFAATHGQVEYGKPENASPPGY